MTICRSEGVHMVNKKSFVLPCDCLDDLEDFTVEEAGELFLAILKYVNTGKEPCFCDRAMKMYFRRIKNYIDGANENYEKMIQANKANGAKGGRPKKPRNRTVSEKTDGFSEKPKKADTDTDTESDIDTESVLKESDRENSPTQKYGENGNVMLTDAEYERLAEQMGVSKRDEYIDKLGDYMASTGKKYQSHYATIRNWFRRDGGKKSESPSYDMNEYSDRGEALPVYSKEGN